jgi:hypothetical protein
MNQPFIDPDRIDKKIYDNIIYDNVRNIKSKGAYTMLPERKKIKTTYLRDFNLSTPTTLCETSVVYSHCLDIAEQYAEHGINNLEYQVMDPVIVNTVGKSFSGANYGIRDEIKDPLIHLRTSFCSFCYGFEFRDENCAYTNLLMTIRPPNVLANVLPPTNAFRTAMIIAPVLSKPTIIDGKLSVNDIAKLWSIIECVFQTCITAKHNILILPPYGIIGNEIPIDDVILIYNHCIYKYGHRIKKIIIAVPPYFPDYIFNCFNEKIVNTQSLFKEIDERYDYNDYIKEATAKQPQEELYKLKSLLDEK